LGSNWLTALDAANAMKSTRRPITDGKAMHINVRLRAWVGGTGTGEAVRRAGRKHGKVGMAVRRAGRKHGKVGMAVRRAGRKHGKVSMAVRRAGCKHGKVSMTVRSAGRRRGCNMPLLQHATRFTPSRGQTYCTHTRTNEYTHSPHPTCRT